MSASRPIQHAEFADSPREFAILRGEFAILRGEFAGPPPAGRTTARIRRHRRRAVIGVRGPGAAWGARRRPTTTMSTPRG